MEQRWLSAGAVGAMGVLLAGVQIVHAVQQTDIAIAVVVDAVPFVAMGLGVAFTGFWLAREQGIEGQAVRVALWSVGGVLAMASVAALVLFGQRVTTGTLDRAAYLTMDLVTVGALGGVLVGLYDARSQQRRVELEGERDRIEAFAGKAADVNNYGRAISSARNVDGVSAYVVEAVETLVGLRETVVARVASEVELIADTTRTIDGDAVGELARDARTQPPRDVVVRDEGKPGQVSEEVVPVVTALVHDDAECAFVVVALNPGGDAVAEEDRQLLELVVAHAGATIRQLDAQRVQ